jgi:flagellar hook-associated protein 1 FlgK
MSGITDALNNAGNSMNALERALSVIQENVGNASTPGYARQDQAVAIDSSSDANVTQTISSRDQFAEAAVRQQNSLFGHYDQLNSILQSAQSNFPASGDSGIPAAINNLFSSFSALSTSPNDATARELVIAQAGQLASNFTSTSDNLAGIEASAKQQISSEVDTINHLASLVQQYNTTSQVNSAGVKDPIVDAKLNDTLEQLSEFGNIQALQQSDGSISLLIGGQTALVVGASQFPLTADVASGATAKIRDSNGNDITSTITGGRLSGSLQAVNQSIPSYLDGLNQLAKGIADTVNTTLASGVDSNGAAGAPLFTYNPAAGAAATLAVTNITQDQLAAASGGAPGGNGNALALSALGTAPSLNGFTYAGFFGNVAAQVGQDVSNASDGVSVQTQLLAQARAQRTDVSGVSLDDEAIQLVAFQRAYEATAKVVSALDQLSLDTINMLQGT